jgi:Uma2 family endonuclease
MNELSPVRKPRPTTQAAEGVPRLRWSLAEFERLTELGIFTEDDRIELIGGELVPMSPKGNRHETVKTKILNWMMRRLPEGLELSIELGWRADDDTYLEPDIVVFPVAREVSLVAPGDMLLVIEVGASSYGFDTGRKSQVYAALGVRDYWVVNAANLETRVFREPSANGYRATTQVAPGETLTPLLVPPLALRLADLGLD